MPSEGGDSTLRGCVFCRVLAADLPGAFVYRDHLCSVFLDSQPIVSGHLLVVPNRHVASLAELAEETGQHLFVMAQRMASALRSSWVRCEGVNLLLADGTAAMQEVPHVHLHVLPRYAQDGFGFRFPETYSNKPSAEELAQVAGKIRERFDQENGALHLRPATPADVAFLRDLHHRVFRDVVQAQFGKWDEAEQDGWFGKGLRETEFRIVKLGDAEVGAIGTLDTIESLQLAELQILPKWQNRGLGSALLELLLLRARAQHKPVSLRVLHKNRARALYERKGFRVIDHTDTHLMMEWKP